MRLNPLLRLSPTDLSNFHSCRHRTALDLGRAAGELEFPEGFDGMANRLAALGEAHEEQYVDKLRADKLSVADLRPLRARKAPEDEIVAATLEAMSAGVEVIVQAALRHGDWFGYADVLRRVETPSNLGAFSYEAHDAKLARETKAGTILQLSVYTELVAAIQGTVPENFCVVTPLGSERYRFTETEAVYRRVRGRLLDSLSLGWEGLLAREYPEPVLACEVCAWWRRCEARRRADDHLSFIAGVTRVQRIELVAHEAPTLAAAAGLPDPLPWKPARGSRDSYLRTVAQARLQVATRTSEPRAIARETLPVVSDAGLCLLPEPSPGDLFLDFEGDPFGRPLGGGREYLTGLGWLSEGGLEYSARWAFDDAAEKAAFEATIDLALERWEQAGNEGLHIYHFGHYEPSALKRLMGRHATRAEELDRLLRGGRFVDLHRVVKGALRAGIESYSIKELEALTGFERTVPLDDARRTLRAVERCLEDGAADLLPAADRAAVEGYNRDDCASTLALRDWLEGLRTERVAAGESVPRPVAKPDEPSKALKEIDDRIRAAQERLLSSGDEQPIRRLFASLLAFHRLEAKAQSWEYFRLSEMDDEDLLDEGRALVALSARGAVGDSAKVFRFSYPHQEMDLRVGDTLRIRGSESTGVGKIVEVDRAERIVDIRGSAAKLSADISAVFPQSFFGGDVHTDSLLNVADRWISATETDSCGLRLLRRQAPSGSSQDPLRRIFSLEGDVLGIQGPPGTGKTRQAASMIVALVTAGKSVGVTALSHRVIANLLEKVHAEGGGSVRLGRKVSSGDESESEAWESFTDNQDFAAGLASRRIQVGGATTFFWSRPEARGLVDYLFVDEAGQISLAATLAAAPAARNLVLLGDPQQLDQPRKVSHPDGVDVSALGHLLDGTPTMPPDRGIFLPETWRLSQPICELTSELFYEGRLLQKSGEGLERMALTGTDGFDGVGLFWHPVVHQGRTNSSQEEIEAVEEVLRRLLRPGSSWTDCLGEKRELEAKDILVVAPFNAHVTHLIDRLPSLRGQIGTVDKFQGQEAPVVIYTMATSSAEDAPRGMEFLFSLNRFNVATSRARCAVIVVASPRLLDADCRTPRQLQLANALCRFVELARPVLP